MSVRDSTFCGNRVVGYGLVEVFMYEDDIEFENNAGSADDSLTCSFMAVSGTIPEEDRQVTCLSFDTDGCVGESSLPPSSTPTAMDSTLTPVATPTTTPTPQPTSTGSPTKISSMYETSSPSLPAITKGGNYPVQMKMKMLGKGKGKGSSSSMSKGYSSSMSKGSSSKSKGSSMTMMASKGKGMLMMMMMHKYGMSY